MNQWRWLSNCRLCLVLAIAVGSSVAAGEPRDIANMEFTGNRSIESSAIRKALRNTPSVIAVCEPVISEDAFRHELARAIRSGYARSGFADCSVLVDATGSDSEQLKATILEGPHTTYGSLRFDLPEDDRKWFSESLAKYQEAQKQTIWRYGQSWPCTPNQQSTVRQNLDKWLALIGIHPSAVVTKFTQDSTTDGARSVSVVLHFAKTVHRPRVVAIKSSEPVQEGVVEVLTEAGLGVGSAYSPDSAHIIQQKLLAAGFEEVKVRANYGVGLGDIELNIDGLYFDEDVMPENAFAIREKVMAAWHKYFVETVAAPAWHVKVKSKETEAQLWILENASAVQLVRGQRELLRMIGDRHADEVRLQLKDGSRVAVGLPNVSMSMLVKVEPDTGRVSNAFGANFHSSEREAASNRCDMECVAMAKLFPMDTSELHATTDGIEIAGDRALLVLSADGRLKRLEICNDNDYECMLEPCRALPAAIAQLQQDKDIACPMRVTELSPRTTENDFLTVPLDVAREATPRLARGVAGDTLGFKQSTLVAQLADACSIAATGNRQALDSILKRIEAKNEVGPLAELALAYIASTAGDIDSTKRYAALARQHMADPAKLALDWNAIAVADSGPGELARHVDLRPVYELAIEIADIADSNEATLAMIKLAEPPTSEPLKQWQTVAQRLVTSWLIEPAVKLATQLEDSALRTAAVPK